MGMLFIPGAALLPISGNDTAGAAGPIAGGTALATGLIGPIADGAVLAGGNVGPIAGGAVLAGGGAGCIIFGGAPIPGGVWLVGFGIALTVGAWGLIAGGATPKALSRVLATCRGAGWRPAPQKAPHCGQIRESEGT